MPVQLSGGAGFALEDSVAAHFLLAMLRGEMVFGPEHGVAIQLDFQVGESGWLLDDLLLTGMGQSGSATHVAVSVKTPKQVTAKGGFAPSFANAAWQQWTGSSNGPFDKEHDLLCLAVENIADEVWKAWHELQSEALGVSDERFLERVASTTKTKKAIFRSLIPDPDRFSGVDKDDAVELLRRVRLLKFDFQQANSDNVANATVHCRALIVDEVDRSAVDLWDALRSIAKEHRVVGGTVDLQKLTRYLVNQGFRLAPYPSFANDWHKLNELSVSTQGLIRTQIGTGLELPRTESRDLLCKALAGSRAIVLLGPSGVGKSALLTRVLEESEGTVCWLNASHFRYSNAIEQRTSLGLENTLGRILRSSTSAKNTLVIDAVEAFSDSELELLTTTLDDARLSDAPEWTLALTSQVHAWEPIQSELYTKCRIRPSTYEVGAIDASDIDHLLQECGITQFRYNETAKSLFGNLKILDWIVCAIAAQPPDSSVQTASIARILNIVWQYWIGKGGHQHATAKLLQFLGSEQAATFNRGVPFEALDYGATELLSALESRDVLRVQNESVYFSHDLIGDWIRFRVLLKQEEMQGALRSRADNPVWHNAIRLYGQSLLDQADTKQPSWESVQKGVRNESPQGDIVGDLLLDAVWSHPNAYTVLTQHRDVLFVDNPDWFQRIVKRFLLGATVADPRAAALTSEDDMRLLLETSMRMPLWMQWPPLLRFLHDNIANVVRHASQSVASICALWLRHTTPKTKDGAAYPLREEAATVALALAEEVRARDEERSWFQGKEKVFYEAALHAAHDLPDAVGQFALEMAQRCPMNEALQQRLAEHRKKQLLEQIERQKNAPKKKRPQPPISLSSFRGERLDPWPQGPADGVKDTFREAAWATNGLNGLMVSRPDIAAEIILALCIEEPGYEYENDSDLQKPGLAYWRMSLPEIYFNGPFLSFLQGNSNIALDLILDLVNFVTDRWVSRGQRKYPDAEPPSLTFPIQGEERSWIGNWHVFGWFRGVGSGDCPVTCALMALEQWLYVQLDAGRDVTSQIDKILAEGRSVAFAGVLCSVGKKHPDLFEGPLRPLLGAAEIYEWDHALVRNNNVAGFGSMLWARHGEVIFEMLRAWHTMPHRNLELRGIAQDHLVENTGLQTFFRDRIAIWQQDDAEHEFLCAQLDIQNYSKAVDETGAEYWQLTYPPELALEAAKGQHDAQYAQLVLELPQVCQQLFDQKNGLATDKLDAFSKTLKALGDSEPDPDPFIEQKKPAAILAGFGVLAKHHRDWLSSHPEIGRWGKSYLVDLLNKAPPAGDFDSPVSVDPSGWEAWAGRLSVVLLCEDPNDARWREAVARLTMGSHYLTTGIVLETAFDRRDVLGDEFVRILNVAKVWSAVELVWGRDDGPQSVRRRQQLIDAYCSRRLPATPMSLQRIAEGGERFRTRHRIRQYRPFDGQDMAVVAERIRQSRHSGLNWAVVVHVLSWLPDRLMQKDEALGQLAAQEFSDLTSYCLSIAPRDPDEKSCNDIPNELIRWWLARVATLTMVLAPNEAKAWWQPIMELGITAHYWVDAFVSAFFLEGAKAAASPEAFRRQWQPLIEYTLDSETWQQQGYRDYRRCRTVFDVMGLRVGTTVVGDIAFKDVIASLAPMYRQWAAGWFHEGEAANAFAAFLMEPSATTIIPDGIVWLNKAL